MRVPRLYVDSHLEAGMSLLLPAAAHRHCIQVLRLSNGDRVILFNGDGNDYPATLETVARREASVRIDGAETNRRESPLTLHLIQGLSKGEHMDLTVQKAVELGVSAIQPVICARSQRLPADRLDRRHAHWQAIIQSACEQCGRSHLPNLSPVTHLEEWLSTSAPHLFTLLMQPDASDTLETIESQEGAVAVLIGPEGGFTDAELAQAMASGVRPVRLGPRVLRTESAAIAAMALLQARWGDLMR